MNQFGLSHVILFGLLLLCVSACQSNEPPKPTHLPVIILGKDGVLLNTFTVSQSEFPIMGNVDSMPAPPEKEMIQADEARALTHRIFSERGFDLEKDVPFSFGKVHVKLDGYQRETGVGFVWISKDEYESPKAPPGNPKAKGYFYTEKSPDKFSIPEIIMLERFNTSERTYVAMINAHQFVWPKDADAETNKKRMQKRLSSRLSLYLTWVESRLAAREQRRQKQQQEKK